MFWNTLRREPERDTFIPKWIHARETAHFLKGRIVKTVNEITGLAEHISVWTSISGLRKKVIANGKKIEIKWRLAIEVQLEWWIWICCFVDSCEPIKLPWTNEYLSRICEIHQVFRKKAINFITDKWTRVCLFQDSLCHVKVPCFRGWEPKQVTMIIKWRP